MRGHVTAASIKTNLYCKEAPLGLFVRVPRAVDSPVKPLLLGSRLEALPRERREQGGKGCPARNQGTLRARGDTRLQVAAWAETVGWEKGRLCPNAARTGGEAAAWTGWCIKGLMGEADCAPRRARCSLDWGSSCP